jgi:hypothetical protein
MAVEAFLSTQRTDGNRLRPIDKHGKFRIAFFQLEAVTVAGDAGSTVELTDLPPGAVRILPHMSRLIHSAWGSSRTLAIGHKAYQKTGSPAAEEALNASAFVAAYDISGAVTTPAVLGTALKYDVYSLGGVVLYATVAGGTIPIGATLSGYFAYIYE